MTPRPIQLPLAKRWRDRRQQWVAPGELFSPAGYAVDVLPERIAKPWVCERHYAGTFPAARLSCGLFASTGVGSRLVGVAVFSVPMNQAVIPSYSGLSPSGGVELGRFVCAPEVHYNGESWFLARAFEQLRREKPDLRVVLSYADPLERRSDGGIVVKPAHWGVIYQASNALYVGRSSRRMLTLGPTGRVISGRAVSKVRLGERGSEYAERMLVAAGVPKRPTGENPATWLDANTGAECFAASRTTGTWRICLASTSRRERSSPHSIKAACLIRGGKTGSLHDQRLNRFYFAGFGRRPGGRRGDF